MHARFVGLGDGAYGIEEAGSANGGQKLRRGDLHPLHNGDRIRLGEAVLLFRKQGEADIWNRVVFYPTGDV